MCSFWWNKLNFYFEEIENKKKKQDNKKEKIESNKFDIGRYKSKQTRNILFNLIVSRKYIDFFFLSTGSHTRWHHDDIWLSLSLYVCMLCSFISFSLKCPFFSVEWQSDRRLLSFCFSVSCKMVDLFFFSVFFLPVVLWTNGYDLCSIFNSNIY